MNPLSSFGSGASSANWLLLLRVGVWVRRVENGCSAGLGK